MENENQSPNWSSLLRIIAKAVLLVLLLNILFAAFSPLEGLGNITLYNWLFPGRERLPYGENAQESYNLSLFNIPAMIASHTIKQPKAEDEYRVIILGDSGAWGWLLENNDTLAARISQSGYVTGDGRRVEVYNLGYPIMSLTKDLMILDAAMAHDPDLIIWPVTLESFPREKQLFSPLVQNNPSRIRSLIARYDLQLDPLDPRFIEPTFFEQTIIGQRRNLADLLRHQLYALSWAATGVDQVMPEQITLRRSDFDEDVSWQEYEEPITLSTQELAFDALDAGIAIARDTPLLIVNEPMYISNGLNSDLRYNSFYPRWAYDQYRQLLQETAVARQWRYLDLWDTIPPGEFTDTPVHLTPNGSQLLADRLAAEILDITAQ